MLTNTPTSAKRVALRSFTESLRTASVTLAEAKKAYHAAQDYYRTLNALVDDLVKEGITLDDEANEVSNEGAPALGVVPPAPPTSIAPRKKAVVKKTKKINVRDLIMELLKQGNAVMQTKDILAKVRASQGPDYPASTVSAALAQLEKDKFLHRVRNPKMNTSTFGPPEWFDGDTPKDVHILGF